TNLQDQVERSRPPKFKLRHHRTPVRRAIYTGTTLKPVQRPKTNTRIQQVSEIEPASRAAAGGVGWRSHSCTLRTVMNSKISMLMAAKAMMNSLTLNVVVAK